MNKNLIFLIFSMYIFVNIQNSLHAMEAIDPIEDVRRFEDKLKQEKINSVLMRCIKKIEIALEEIRTIERELQILKDAEQLHNNNKISLSNEESKKEILKLTKIQLQKQKKEIELIKRKDKLQKLEQKKEQSLIKQKHKHKSLLEQEQLRDEKIKKYIELLEKYDVQPSTINKEVQKCYLLGDAPGKFIVEQVAETNSVLNFFKEIEEKILVFPARDWIRIINMYPRTFQWKSNQKMQPSITENSPIITNLIQNVNFIGKVDIREEDIHHNGKLDSVVASLDNNEIKYTITMDETANLNFEKTMPYRISKNLAHVKNLMNPYGQVLNDKFVGGGVGGFVGGGIGFLLSQIFKIDPTLSVKCGMATCAIITTLLAGGVKQVIEKQMEERNERDALNILGSRQGVEEYSRLKIVSEKCSYETNKNSNLIGNKYFIVKDEQAATSKQPLLNTAKNYPLKNKKVVIARRQFMDENHELQQLNEALITN